MKSVVVILFLVLESLAYGTTTSQTPFTNELTSSSNIEPNPDYDQFRIIMANPANGASYVPLDAQIYFEANLKIDPTSITSENVVFRTISHLRPIVVHVVKGNAIRIVPTFPLRFNQTFHVTVKGGPTGIKSVDGRELGGDVALEFTTGSDISDFDYSYFSPKFGTVNIMFGPPPSHPRLIGAPIGQAIAVASSIGTNVTIINADGTTRCRINLYPGNPGSLAMYGNLLATFSFEKVLLIDPADCRLVDELNPQLGALSHLSVLGDNFIFGLNGDGGSKGNVRLWNPQTGTIWTDPMDSYSPRYALVHGESMIVSDTFQHRIYSVNMINNKLEWEIKSYFPNETIFVNDHNMLAVEEHLNRIVEVDLRTFEKSIYLACPHPIFQNPKSIRYEVDPTTIGPWPKKYPKSICATEFAGKYTLYSPNSMAFSSKGHLAVTDDDNHRVVVFSSKNLELVSEFIGFNTPSRVLFLPD